MNAPDDRPALGNVKPPRNRGEWLCPDCHATSKGEVTGLAGSTCCPYCHDQRSECVAVIVLCVGYST